MDESLTNATTWVLPARQALGYQADLDEIIFFPYFRILILYNLTL